MREFVLIGLAAALAACGSGGGGEELSLTVAEGVECRHADPASIYGTAAAMWSVAAERTDEVDQLRMTLWRPKGGGAEQMGLRLEVPSGLYEIDTVDGDGTVAGSATTTLEPEGEGGRFVVEGLASDGTPLHLTIECPSFGGIEAVGG